MLLTEKEIEGIARSIFLQHTKAVPIWAMKDMARDVRLFAAAIAKRLGEGVVYEGLGEKYEGWPELSDDEVRKLNKAMEELVDGQLVEVSVRKVEGTKNGS